MKLKKIVFLLVLFLFNLKLFSQEPSCWKSVEEIDLKEYIHDNNNDILNTEKYTLKKGYELIFRPVMYEENNIVCRNTQVYLVNGNNIKLLASQDGGGNIGNVSKYLYRYGQIDFDDYFVISLFNGDYQHYLYSKKTGEKVLEFSTSYSFAYNLENNLLVYKISENLDEKVYLLDLKKFKSYELSSILENEKSKMMYWEVQNYWDQCFEIISASSKKVKIQFTGFYKPVLDENEEVIDTLEIKYVFDVLL